ncbi:endolytic transglycosylase MltG [Bacillus sp. HMF5848]|uniref:endolytic transglycosylase MltG n=1 Tax=Bacillus sp. HMF5848 TaxID=2495421 RepID=UPI000F775215|nr:endolytic transglycosylase MltG [Bacillus sp. HMF5848]RSK29387.1 endolytic transglycosylase MltG [Bacillus sp. HMF5848]
MSQFKSNLLERSKEARVVRRIVLVLAIIMFALVIGTMVGGYLYVSEALQPVDETSNKEVAVSIPLGSSVTAIANILEEQEIIRDAKIFKYYIKFRNASDFQAGDYTLKPSMTHDEIIAALKQGKIIQEVKFKITIPEGKQLDQIATIIAEKTNHPIDEVMGTLTDEAYLEELMDKYPSILTDEILAFNIRYPLEGYLYPATYSFYEEEPSIKSVIEAMLDKTAQMMDAYFVKMEEKGMTVHELLTFASLVEEEATEQTDRKMIASVFYNRLNEGMPLQTDPTVLYALGEHKQRVLYADLEVESPYNTYKIIGLPPGPIANAGVTSISAVLEPADTDYFYFFATPTGQNEFSRTLNEHNRKLAEFR